jgi:hypothetical protein
MARMPVFEGNEASPDAQAVRRLSSSLDRAVRVLGVVYLLAGSGSRGEPGVMIPDEWMTD